MLKQGRAIPVLDRSTIVKVHAGIVVHLFEIFLVLCRIGVELLSA